MSLGQSQVAGGDAVAAIEDLFEESARTGTELVEAG
jgi:hypothetical protein